jgi:hypothetical protein
MVGVSVMVGVGVRVPVWVTVSDWVAVGIFVKVTVGCGELVAVQIGKGEGVGEGDEFDNGLQEISMPNPMKRTSLNQLILRRVKGGSYLS